MIAANAAGVPFTDGIVLRFVILILCWLACVVYVMRYAERVRQDPERPSSPTGGVQRGAFPQGARRGGDVDLTFTRKIILLIFASASRS